MKKFLLLLIVSFSIIISGCAAKDKYNMQQFQRLSPGMSYSECSNILTTQGKLMSENYMPGVPGVMDSIHTQAFSWQNENGSNIFLMFQNDKLIQKSQYGLK